MKRNSDRIVYIAAAIVAVALALVLLASCGTDKATEQFKDAPRGQYDKTTANVMAFPDGFSNVAHKCDGPNMVYVAFHGDSGYAAVAVVPDDPRCPRG